MSQLREDYVTNLRRRDFSTEGALAPGDMVVDVGDDSSMGVVIAINEPPYGEWDRCLVLWSKEATGGPMRWPQGAVSAARNAIMQQEDSEIMRILIEMDGKLS